MNIESTSPDMVKSHSIWFCWGYLDVVVNSVVCDLFTVVTPLTPVVNMYCEGHFFHNQKYRISTGRSL